MSFVRYLMCIALVLAFVVASTYAVRWLFHQPVKPDYIVGVVSVELWPVLPFFPHPQPTPVQG